MTSDHKGGSWVLKDGGRTWSYCVNGDVLAEFSVTFLANEFKLVGNPEKLEVIASKEGGTITARSFRAEEIGSLLLGAISAKTQSEGL